MVVNVDFLYYIKMYIRFQHKVGLFYDTKSLNDRISKQSALETSTEGIYTNSKCYACDIKKVSKKKTKTDFNHTNIK